MLKGYCIMKTFTFDTLTKLFWFVVLLLTEYFLKEYFYSVVLFLLKDQNNSSTIVFTSGWQTSVHYGLSKRVSLYSHFSQLWEKEASQKRRDQKWQSLKYNIQTYT